MHAVCLVTVLSHLVKLLQAFGCTSESEKLAQIKSYIATPQKTKSYIAIFRSTNVMSDHSDTLQVPKVRMPNSLIVAPPFLQNSRVDGQTW